MSIKSLLPAAAAMAVAALALTGCTQNNAAPAESSSPTAPAATSAPAGSSSEAPAGTGEAPAPSSQAPAAAPTAAAQDAAGTLTVNESNEHVSVPAGTTMIIVNGSNNHIDGGALAEITVSGSNNAIDVESVQHVSLTGSNNTIEYKKGNAPQVSDMGANNEVSMGD